MTCMRIFLMYSHDPNTRNSCKEQMQVHFLLHLPTFCVHIDPCVSSHFMCVSPHNTYAKSHFFIPIASVRFSFESYVRIPCNPCATFDLKHSNSHCPFYLDFTRGFKRCVQNCTQELKILTQMSAHVAEMHVHLGMREYLAYVCASNVLSFSSSKLKDSTDCVFI